MAKQPDLEAMLRKAGSPAGPGTSSATPPAQPARQRGRAGTVALMIHVEPEVRRQLKVLAAEKDQTVQQTVCQALNLLFAANHRPEIAR